MKMNRRKIMKAMPDEDAASVNKLKKRIRDLDRQLSHDNSRIPANLRVEKERELAAYRDELQARQEHLQRSHMIGKYHMVRFFGTKDGHYFKLVLIKQSADIVLPPERKKAIRLLKQARQSLERAADADLEQLKEEVRNCEVDLKYTMYYPLNKAYISLYAKGSSKDRPRKERSPQCQEMWETVKKAMAEGNLDALRNGQLNDSGEAESPGGSMKKKKESKSWQKESNSVRAGKNGSVEKEGVTSPSSDEEDGAAFFE